MQSAWFDSIVAWISAHPVAAGLVIFLIAFCDALAVVGIVVPALPLLFAVGTLIGLGHLDGSYALVCAAAGAFVGDGLSYWIGHRWGPQMRELWLFRRYPQLLDRGETLFRRHGSKGILTARFVGAVRPFVPAVAGMLHMPLKRYAPASAAAAVAWAALFLAPGWLFGTSYEVIAAVADKLALVLLALVAVVALAWAMVLYTWRWFAAHADTLLARALRWTRAHPILSRWTAPLIDPRRPESASLLLLAACLFLVAWLWAGFSASLLMAGGPSLLDHDVHAAMFSLRNPLADRLMATLAALGSGPVLGSSAAAAMLWLLWRRRWQAAAHWLAAIAFGWLLTAGLAALVHMPRPPTAVAGFGFPSVAVTMTTVVFGFFAVLIARELPGRARVWPYLLAGIATVTVGFARLYLGAHWLSDVIGGVLLGVIWVLALGIAYRRRSDRSLWMRPLAWTFYGSFLLAASWYAPRTAEATLARFEPPPPEAVMADAAWENGGLPDLTRIDLQARGSLELLQQRLLAQGWSVQPQADWVAALGLLDDALPLDHKPVLPVALAGRAERLLLRRQGAVPGHMEVLRVWPAPVRLASGVPLWVARHERVQARERLLLLTLWQPEPGPHALPADLQALAGHHADGALDVRVR